MFIVSFATGPWQANCYIIAAKEPGDEPVDAIVIDPGVGSAEPIRSFCSANNLKICAIYCTHGHIDHIADAATLANEFGIAMWMHPDDDFMVTEPVNGLGTGSEELIRSVLGSLTLPQATDRRNFVDSMVVSQAGIDLEVVHAPGHSPGCVILIGTHDNAQIVFSGDVLFAQSVGRVDLPRGNPDDMVASLRKINAVIDDEAGILPGHGSSTTMAQERQMNPYLKEALA